MSAEEESAVSLFVAALVAVEEEGAVLVAALVIVEEEGAVLVAMVVDVEVSLCSPNSSLRRLLVLRLLDGKLVENFLLLLGMFRKKLWKKLEKKNTPGALTSTMQATKMRCGERAPSYTLVRKTGLKPVLTGSTFNLQVLGGGFLSGVGGRGVGVIPF